MKKRAEDPLSETERTKRQRFSATLNKIEMNSNQVIITH